MKLSNQDWVSRSDPEAKIAKMKDGTTHLAYKPEHAVDLDTGAVVAAEHHLLALARISADDTNIRLGTDPGRARLDLGRHPRQHHVDSWLQSN